MSDRPIIPFILATAGHVDHGKSALVKAMTGIDPDRLPDEKRRGITIDLGFAHLRLPSPSRANPAVDYLIGIVDVPGHENFIKNMVAGVGAIDAALIVVAADDGWMPQTEEHLQILRYRGVSRGVIALTKIDLANEAAIDGLRERLLDTPFHDSPIVPTSIVSGRGIDDLKLELGRLFAGTPPQRDIGKPRLSVDRVFTLKGMGTVVTGTLTGGALHRGQKISIQPQGAIARIRSMQMHNQEVASGQPGSRIALNLPDIQPATARSPRTPNSVARGDVITLPGLGNSISVFDALVQRLGEAATAKPLRSGAIVRVHHGSGSTAARIELFDRKTHDAPGHALARLVLKTPIFAFSCDRFVIRDWSEQYTMAGGTILDVHKPRVRSQRPKAGSAARKLLEARTAAPDDPCIFVRTQIERDGVSSRQMLLNQSCFSAEEIALAIDVAIASGAVVASGDVLVDRNIWSTALDRAAHGVDEHHRKHPEQPGLPISDLRAAMAPLDPAAIDALTSAMCRDGFLQDGTTVRRRTHKIALPPRLNEAGRRLRQLLADHPFDPPSKKELCPDDLSHQALKFLLATGEAVSISAELILSAESVSVAIEKIRAFLQSHGSATVSELKSILVSSRRVMVPLLEKLDREKITAREGDRRTLSRIPTTELTDTQSAQRKTQ